MVIDFHVLILLKKNSCIFIEFTKRLGKGKWENFITEKYELVQMQVA